MELSWSAALSAEEGRKLAAQLFEETFGYQPQDVWSAPGRVNVIGEHVDYNGGPCLPIALPHRAFIAYAPREDRLLRLVSPQTREAVDELDPAVAGFHPRLHLSVRWLLRLTRPRGWVWPEA